MRMINLKIRTQLQLGLIFIFAFVVLLGIASYFQTENIAAQTQMIYEHPLQVRRAIGHFKADILSIQLDLEEIMFTDDKQAVADVIARIDKHEVDAYNQIKILRSQYLGPQNDVDVVEQEFAVWNSIREETVHLFLEDGPTAEAIERIKSTGVDAKQAEKVLKALDQIDIFAMNKGNAIYATSQQLKQTLHRQLIILVVVISGLCLLINYLLMHNIRQPLNELGHVARELKNGNYGARSSYMLDNEFGELSNSFNQLAVTIQQNLDLKDKSSNLTSVMLHFYNETEQFFKAMLASLVEHTGSQMAALYLKNPDKSSFEHFASVGLSNNARASFDANDLEGEFGAVLASGKIQHITNIPIDSRFTFAAVTGEILPREIITVPIISNNQIIAVISLANIKNYTPHQLKFVDEIWEILNVRVDGILAFRQIQMLVGRLELQNRELEIQKNELNAQAAELNQQNRELEAQKKQLDETNRLKTSFISNMSHELRTPLNSVIALTGVLNRRLVNKIPEEEYSFLGVIEHNGKQLLALINDILDLSRIEAGREEIDASLFDLNELIDEVVSTVAPLARQKNIGLIYQPVSDSSSIVSDYTKCRQILQNLAGNAVKFTETGQVKIETRQSDGRIDISVIDTGIGISEEHIKHIFEEFRQADESTSRRYGGSGLGLTIAKKYAALLGGEILVKSELGKGSEFTLSLPLRINISSNHSTELERSAIPKQHPSSSQILTADNLSQKTILLVDDNDSVIIQLKDVLEESDCQILVSHNGTEALEAMKYVQPDAIILDLMMPDVDGFELLKIIRSDEKIVHAPILILTAKHITKEELKFLTTNNIYQLIQKGDVNRNELLNAVIGMVTPREKVTETPRPTVQAIEGQPVVLVVEDNPDNMLTTRALLADQFNVIEAADGKTGIEQAEKYIPHLILMDIALPGMDGVETFHVIRNNPRLRHIPIIALTASAMSNEREAILAYGFDSYISKPIDQAIFMHTIYQVLYGYR